jgi:hypothetical protein
MDRCRDALLKKGLDLSRHNGNLPALLEPFFVLSLFIAPSTTFVI